MHQYTIGIEEEYQIIDVKSRALISHVAKIIEGGKATLKEQAKREMHEAVVEIETGICQNITQAREEMYSLRKNLIEISHQQNLRVSGGGTHPFSHWHDQSISPNPRYGEIVGELGDVARSNLIFGLHVHIGIPNREEGIRIQNIARYFLPHIYALSTSSPFWLGRNTGYKSYRQKVFAKFPRTGIPSHFNSISDFDSYVQLLVKTNCIDNAKKIWWDLRVHPIYPTIEFRICDMPLRVEETLCLAAIMQCVVAKIHKLHMQNMSFRSYRKMHIDENKWRASRYGIQASLIDFGKEAEVPYHELLEELLTFINDVVDDLGCRKEVEYVHTIVKNGTGADRQLKIFEETGDLSKVVDYMISETEFGIF